MDIWAKWVINSAPPTQIPIYCVPPCITMLGWVWESGGWGGWGARTSEKHWGLDPLCHGHPRGGPGGRHPRQVLRVRRDQGTYSIGGFVAWLHLKRIFVIEHSPEPGPADRLPEGLRPRWVRDLQRGAGRQRGVRRWAFLFFCLKNGKKLVTSYTPQAMTSWVRQLQWSGPLSRGRGSRGRAATETPAPSAFFNYTRFYKLQSWQRIIVCQTHFTILCSRVLSHCVVQLTRRGSDAKTPLRKWHLVEPSHSLYFRCNCVVAIDWDSP